jgi:hypothetical protein
MAVWVGMKWLHLLTESTTTIVALNPCESGSSVIKSTLTMSHHALGIRSRCSLLGGFRFWAFVSVSKSGFFQFWNKPRLQPVSTTFKSYIELDWTTCNWFVVVRSRFDNWLWPVWATISCWPTHIGLNWHHMHNNLHNNTILNQNKAPPQR